VSTDNEERHDICVTSLNGRCTRVLVRVRAPHTFFLEPSLAPDGRTFAVAVDQADQQGTSRVALFDARSGRHVRDVTTGHWDTHPAWSPDGRSLVFTRDAVEAVGGDESSICIVRAQGGPVRCPLRKR
jgi:Tol biopolymer transport system component